MLYLSLTTAFWYLPERRLHTHLKPWCLHVLPRGHSITWTAVITWPQRPAGFTTASLRSGVPILVHFKNCHLTVWLPVSLKLGADWESSFWNADRFWNTFYNWDLSKTNQIAWIITKVQQTAKSKDKVERWSSSPPQSHSFKTGRDLLNA